MRDQPSLPDLDAVERFWLGVNQLGACSFAGAIDQVLAWDRPLAAAELAALAARAAPSDDGHLVLDLPLDTCGQQAFNSYRNDKGKHVKYGDLSDGDNQNVAYAIMASLNLNMQWHVGHHDWVLMDLETDSYVHVDNCDRLVKVKLRDLEKDAQQAGDLICEPPVNPRAARRSSAR